MSAVPGAVCGIHGLRSAELGVGDLRRSVEFYGEMWGLQVVASGEGAVYMRAAGPEHHVLVLREQSHPALLGAHFAAANREAVDRLHAGLKAGGTAHTAPVQLPAFAGGGYGLRVSTPDGLAVTVSADVARHALLDDPSRPLSLTHVVLNSTDVAAQLAFFRGQLGFRVSDTTAAIVFMRCGIDHHSLALAHGKHASLNHLAFEMTDFDALMRGGGRLTGAGSVLEWGVGRHGPGNNIFAYFLDPDGFAVEYTTGMQHVDEATYVAQTADYWANFPMRPCRWGMARKPSEAMIRAFSGELRTEPQGEFRAGPQGEFKTGPQGESGRQAAKRGAAAG